MNYLEQLLGALAGDATRTQVVYEAIAAALCMLLAWLVARAVFANRPANAKWRFGKGDFERVAFPFIAWAFLWIARAVLGRIQDDVHLLQIVVSLVFAYAVVRLAIYVLGHVIPEGKFQRVVIRIIYAIAFAGAVLYVTGHLGEILAVLDSHGFTFGKNKSEITLLDLLKGVVALFLTIVFALWLSSITESRVMAAESVELTTRVVITKVVRIAALFIAIFVALPMAGIDITTLSIFGGALGVGLGFGLQKIASNYVSGFIVLLDRSLRIGDVITVDGRRGEVKEIGSRYTVIKGGDGVESIIPNEKLITESVNHHTYSDPKVSVVITVTVAYETDVERAIGLLHEAAKKQARVIDDPPSAGRVKQLTDHGIELELTVWIKDPALGEGDVRSDLLKDILKTFRAAAISIPYARREIRVLATPETANPSVKSAG
jgi:small-conductance mechanosensitive channel